MRYQFQTFIFIGCLLFLVNMGLVSDWGRSLESNLFMLQPMAWLLALVIGGTALFYFVRLAEALSLFDGKMLWMNNIRQVGIVIPFLCFLTLWGLLLAGILEIDWEFVASLPTQQVLTGVITLFAGVHGALLFSPEDEPIIEVLLSVPHPLSKLIGGRVIVMIFIYLMIGIMSQILLTEQISFTVTEALILWVPGLILLPNLGLLVTVITRQIVFGVGLVVIIWGAFFLYGSSIIRLAPYIYSVHIFPLSIWSDAELFLVNRITIISLGLFCFIWVLSFLAKEESVLTTDH